MSLTQYAAILLDLDGTLVDSEPLQREGYRRYFADRGWPLPDLTLFTGRRAEDVLPTLDGPWRDHDHAVAAPAQLIRQPLHEAVDLVVVFPGPRCDLSDGKWHQAQDIVGT